MKQDFSQINAALALVDKAASLDTRPPAPAVRLLRGDAVVLEAVQWAWHGFLPVGMLTLLGGAPGCGKTTIAMSMAATITTAGQWPDGTRCAHPGDVMIWSGEDPPAVTAARLVASGANMTRVHFIDGLTGAEGEGFDPGRHMELLEVTARKLAAPRLLILDPIVSAVTGDGHKSNDVRRSLQPVVDLAQRLGCAVLGITHFSKGTGGRDPVERLTGSLAFGALARLVLMAAKHRKHEEGDEPRSMMVRAKSNIGPDDGGFAYALERVDAAPGVEGQRVAWLEALQGSAREILAEAEAVADEDGDDASDVEAFVRGCLAAGPVPAKTFKADAIGAGYQWHTVQRTAKRLGAESRKDGMQGGWRWGFHHPPKATNHTEGNEDNSLRRVSSSSSSGAALLPSEDCEVF